MWRAENVIPAAPCSRRGMAVVLGLTLLLLLTVEPQFAASEPAINENHTGASKGRQSRQSTTTDHSSPVDSSLLYLDIRGYLPLLTTYDAPVVIEEFQRRLMRSLNQRLNEVLAVDAPERVHTEQLRDAVNRHAPRMPAGSKKINNVQSDRDGNSVSVGTQEANREGWKWSELNPFRSTSSVIEATRDNRWSKHAADPGAFMVTVARQNGSWGGQQERLVFHMPVSLPFLEANAISTGQATTSYLVTETSLPIRSPTSQTWLDRARNPFEQKAFATIRFPKGEAFDLSTSVALDNLFDRQSKGQPRDTTVWSEFRAISSAAGRGPPIGGAPLPVSKLLDDRTAYPTEDNVRVILGRRRLEELQEDTASKPESYSGPLGFNFGNGGGMTFPDGTTINFGGGGGVHVDYSSHYQDQFGGAAQQGLAKAERLFIGALARTLDWDAMPSHGLEPIANCCTPVAYIDREDQICVESCLSCALAECCLKSSSDSGGEMEGPQVARQTGQPQLIIGEKRSNSASASVCANEGFSGFLKSTTASFRPVTTSLELQIFQLPNAEAAPINNYCSNGTPTKEAIKEWQQALSKAVSPEEFAKLWLDILDKIRKCLAEKKEKSEIALKSMVNKVKLVPYLSADCVMQHLETVLTRNGKPELTFCIQACVSPKVANLHILKDGTCPTSMFKLKNTVPGASRFVDPTQSSDMSVWVQIGGPPAELEDDKWLFETGASRANVLARSNSLGGSEGYFGDQKLVSCTAEESGAARFVAAALGPAGTVLEMILEMERAHGTMFEDRVAAPLGGSSNTLEVPYYQICEDTSYILRDVRHCCSSRNSTRGNPIGSARYPYTNDDSQQQLAKLYKTTPFECFEFETKIAGSCSRDCLTEKASMLGLQEGSCHNSGWFGSPSFTSHVVAALDDTGSDTTDVTCRVLTNGNSSGGDVITVPVEARRTATRLQGMLRSLQATQALEQPKSRLQLRPMERICSTLLREYGDRLLTMLNTRNHELIPRALLEHLLNSVSLEHCASGRNNDITGQSMWSAWRRGMDRDHVKVSSGVQCHFAMSQERFTLNLPELHQEHKLTFELKFPTLVDALYMPILNHLAAEGIINILSSTAGC